MPELPDIEAYLTALRPRVVDQPLLKATLGSPFLLRTVEPPLSVLKDRPVTAVHRIGKRIVFDFPDQLHLVLHLMIAGRLHWKDKGPPKGGKKALLALTFPDGILSLTEAGSLRRASLHLVQSDAALAEFDRGGLEVLQASLDAFARRVRSENHTLKRTLTDPRLLSGIGNAYSDEILHRARLSPMLLTGRITDEEMARLHRATIDVLVEWRERLVAEANQVFPEKVTAFRPEMAVHGRYGLPCPVCAAPVQRIRYASNETNYCPTCQTGGRLLADRSLSRLLKDDWPRSLEELEELNLRVRPPG
ncbi:MAG TPA: DNA-formamidopyrimidine glycosylase family protein [Gemmatimonadales bacterium]|nr:DNA-formamidopyrimidine glycosylase family protein [Gemmatimonadales bacterium]